MEATVNFKKRKGLQVAIKKIKATSEQWGLDFDFTLEFDMGITTVWQDKTYTLEDNLRSSLEFFTGGKEMIEDSDGDLCIAYAKFIGQKVVLESMDWNVDGIIRQFDNAEGYLALDGSTGVKLNRADDFQIEDEFTAKEIS